MKPHNRLLLFLEIAWRGSDSAVSGRLQLYLSRNLPPQPACPAIGILGDKGEHSSAAQGDRRTENECFFQNIYGSLYVSQRGQGSMLQTDMSKSILGIFFAGLTSDLGFLNICNAIFLACWEIDNPLGSFIQDSKSQSCNGDVKWAVSKKQAGRDEPL
jgi:hypothetical protein